MELSATLLLSALSLVGTAAVYAHVGGRIRVALPATGDARLARGAFSLWWYAIALTAISKAVATVAGAFAYTHLGVHVALQVVTMLLLSVALCGLVYYLVFLFTGNARALVPLATAYAAFFALTVYFLATSDIVGVSLGRWNVGLALGGEPATLPRLLIFAFIALPELGGALAYAALLGRTRDPAQRYRIALVSSGIALWALCSILLGANALPDTDAPQVALRLAILGAIGLVFAAYHPPAFVRRRWATPDEVLAATV